MRHDNLDNLDKLDKLGKFYLIDWLTHILTISVLFLFYLKLKYAQILTNSLLRHFIFAII